MATHQDIEDRAATNLNADGAPLSMAKYFDPQLINGPFDDPGLYVDLLFERCAILFDLGDISALVPRKLQRIVHVFITHRHMDHFIGFDRLLRGLLGREQTLNIWGTSGLIDAIQAKIDAYTWNLVAAYDGNLKLRVSELAIDGHLTVAQFAGANRFLREDLGSVPCDHGVLVAEPGYRVRAAILEHGIPVLAFSLQERARINIWRSRVEAMGLAVGPWLRPFKEAILRGDGDDAPIAVTWSEDNGSRPAHLPLGQLKAEIMKITAGRKIAYVVDAAFTQKNADAIVALVENADALFIEATFLHEDAKHAASRNHLTAKQAGMLARRANVKQLRTLHYSPRYRGREAHLANEALAAFLGTASLS
jgi:ribonuclease Z